MPRNNLARTQQRLSGIMYNIKHVTTDMINSLAQDGEQWELEDGDEEEGKKETD